MLLYSFTYRINHYQYQCLSLQQGRRAFMPRNNGGRTSTFVNCATGALTVQGTDRDDTIKQSTPLIRQVSLTSVDLCLEARH